MGDEETWPADIRALFADNFEALCSFEAEDRRIQDLKYKTWQGASEPANPFRGAYDSTIARASMLAADMPIVGRHCTRLHDDEIAEISRTGMETLSLDLLTRRVSARVDAGDLTAAQGAMLISENYVNDDDCGHRLGMLWFCLDVDLEKDQHGVEEFFRFWGGESLYHRHYEDEGVRSLLRSIGTPCIVEATLASEDCIPWGPTVGERLHAAYMGRRKVGANGGWETRIKHALAPEQIRRIIRLGDPAFETLTRCSTWNPQLT